MGVRFCDIPNFTTIKDRFVYALFKIRVSFLRIILRNLFLKCDKDIIKAFPKKCIFNYIKNVGMSWSIQYISINGNSTCLTNIFYSTDL